MPLPFDPFPSMSRLPCEPSLALCLVALEDVDNEHENDDSALAFEPFELFPATLSFERLPFAFEPFDPLKWRSLEFEPFDAARYPAVELAYDALRRGGDTGAVLNAADEVATAAFLEGNLSFLDITATVSQVLKDRATRPIGSLQDVVDADRDARKRAAALIASDLPRSSGQRPHA
ncbi:MAG: hypothetical protein CMJ88_10030 [Planctomycetes bacterium]|nr:hypothetical protein [Planctomycetota bacterium]